jgi:hypothetical protein
MSVSTGMVKKIMMGRMKTNDVEDEDDGSHCALCTEYNKQPYFEKW